MVQWEGGWWCETMDLREYQRKPNVNLNSNKQWATRTNARKLLINSTTVGKIVDGMLHTKKLARRCPVEIRIGDRKGWQAYAAQFLKVAIQNQVLFLDECGFNTWTAISCRRSSKGDSLPASFWTERPKQHDNIGNFAKVYFTFL